MKELTSTIGLKKGDKIKQVEDAIICNNVSFVNGEMVIDHNKEPEHYESVNIFVVKRVNAKTYSCEYIEGAYKNMVFKLYKNHELTNSKKKYYLLEA